MDMPVKTTLALPHDREWRALVCSDSHGRTAALQRIYASAGPLDAVLHLGDVAADARVLEGAAVYSVSGNCDIDICAPFERLLAIGPWRILLTHGHRYGVKRGLQTLYYRAQELRCDMALYGHTHQSALTNPGVLLGNPGSAASMREMHASYAILRLSAHSPALELLTL